MAAWQSIAGCTRPDIKPIIPDMKLIDIFYPRTQREHKRQKAVPRAYLVNRDACLREDAA